VLGTLPPNPRWLPAAGAQLPNHRDVTPITCYSYFLEGICSANVNTVKKNFEIAIMFCFCHSILTSNFAQGTLANATQ